MNRGIFEKAQNVHIDVEEFEQLVKFFCEDRPTLDFFIQRFSTNEAQGIWIPDSKGWTKEDYRDYLKGAPDMICVAADLYRDHFRKEGGRFWIDWCGAYSVKDQKYFVLWKKSTKLTIYASNLKKGPTPDGIRNYIIGNLTSPWTGGH